MKKHVVNLIFYSYSSKREDNAVVKRMQRFLRQENVKLLAEKYTCGVHKFAFSQELFPDLKDAQPPDCGFDHVYHIALEKQNARKLHELVVLLQSYAAYIGMYNSRIYSWKQKN